MLIKSLRSAETYTVSSGTVTVSKYDAKGYAKGTFSLTGKTTAGQTIAVTDGTFKADER